MRSFETRIMTDWGVVRLDGDRAQIIERCRKRKRDDQPDLRFKDGRLAEFIIEAVIYRVNENRSVVGA